MPAGRARVMGEGWWCGRASPNPGGPYRTPPRGLLCFLPLIISSSFDKETPWGGGSYAQEGGYARSLAICRAIAKSGSKSTTTPGRLDTKSTVRNRAAALCSLGLVSSSAPSHIQYAIMCALARRRAASLTDVNVSYTTQSSEKGTPLIDVHKRQVAVKRLPRMAEGGTCDYW